MDRPLPSLTDLQRCRSKKRDQLQALERLAVFYRRLFDAQLPKISPLRLASGIGATAHFLQYAEHITCHQDGRTGCAVGPQVVTGEPRDVRVRHPMKTSLAASS